MFQFMYALLIFQAVRATEFPHTLEGDHYSMLVHDWSKDQLEGALCELFGAPTPYPF